MQYLLDTHTFLWFLEGGEQLSEKAKKEIKDTGNKCFVSVASLWEIAIKLRIGKLILKVPFETLASYLSDNDIELLPLAFEHLLVLISLHLHHRDPFDNIIIAQGITEELTIITKDVNFSHYKAKLLWN